MASENVAQQTDTTFRKFSAEEAENYAGVRMGYSSALVDYIVNYHRTTGGLTGTLLDVGCGPGNATRNVAPHFSRVFGADPGEGMIQAAAKLGGTSATGSPIEWHVSSAEDIAKIPDLQHGEVDMITTATAAHWFNMPLFWEAAAKLVKSGGTVAIWNVYGINNHANEPLIPAYHGATDPLNKNSEQLEKLFDDFTDVVLGPYVTPENRLARSGYEGLEMPWDRKETASMFNKEASIERRWNSNDATGNDRKLFDGIAAKEWPMPAVEAMLGTSSPVVRWREAHPDLVGTDKDCVKVLIKQICEILGVGEDRATLRGGVAISLFCVKKA